MKKFIVRFITFMLPIAICAYFIDAFISSNLKKSNFYTKEYTVWNDIIDGKVNSDIIINGSSRAWVHINPTIIIDSLHISAYNIGIDGHNFWLQNLRHTLLLQKNTKPKLIIHSLDIFTLDKREDLYNPNQFLPYMLWNSAIKAATSSYKGYNIFDYQLPLVRYFGKWEAIEIALKMFKNPPNAASLRTKGFQGQDIEWTDEFEKAKTKMSSLEAKMDSATIALFEQYLINCKAANIKVVLVYSPEYIEGQKFVSNRGKVIATYENLSKKFNIPFYDYSNDAISFDKKYFYNASHMNSKGANLFTSKLVDTLKATKVL